MNPTLPIVLVAIACLAVSAAAVFAANVYRRREAKATAIQAAARQAEHNRTVGLSKELPPQRARYNGRPVQQPAVSDSGASDLVNILLMQQVLGSLGTDHHHEAHRDERPDEHYGSQEQPQEATVSEMAAESESTPYSVPEPAYIEQEPVSYSEPDPAPSYDSGSYDSGSFDSGDSGSF